MKRIAYFLIILSLSQHSLASGIKSKPIDSTYSSLISQDHLDSMQREIQILTSKMEKLEKLVADMKRRAETVNIKNDDPDIETPLVAPGSIKKIETIEEKGAVLKASKGSEKQVYDAALSALKSNDYTFAIKKFEDFIQTYPTSQLIGNAYFWYGEAFFKKKTFDKAALHFLKSYKQAPKGPKAQDSLLKLATTLVELKKNSDACGILNKLDNEFPSRTESSVKKAVDLRTKLKCK